MKSSVIGLSVSAFLLVGVGGWIAGMPHAAQLRSSPPIQLDAAVAGTPPVPAADASAASTGQVPLITSATLPPVVTHKIPAIDPAWIDRVASSTAIPTRALDAYAGAALDLAAMSPGCNLGWNTLAAIGFVESGHGTSAGARIDASGAPIPHITGVALDGIAAAKIADSDGGAIDGDATVDRAVGPMQFIPDSWRRHGVDGNGDGIADPNQIDDAALSAANYLCTGGDLSTADAWNAAILSYNSDPAYVARVAAKADSYAAGVG